MVLAATLAYEHTDTMLSDSLPETLPQATQSTNSPCEEAQS